MWLCWRGVFTISLLTRLQDVEKYDTLIRLVAAMNVGTRFTINNINNLSTIQFYHPAMRGSA